MERKVDEIFFKFIGYDFHAEENLKELFNVKEQQGITDRAFLEKLISHYVSEVFNTDRNRILSENLRCCITNPDNYCNDIKLGLFLLLGEYFSKPIIWYMEKTGLPFSYYEQLGPHNWSIAQESSWCFNLKHLFEGTQWNKLYLNEPSDKTRIEQYSFYNVQNFIDRLETAQYTLYEDCKNIQERHKANGEAAGDDLLDRKRLDALEYGSNAGVENRLVFDMITGASLAEICCYKLAENPKLWTDGKVWQVIKCLLNLRCIHIRSYISEIVIQENILVNTDKKNSDTLYAALGDVVKAINKIYGIALYWHFNKIVDTQGEEYIVEHIIRNNLFDAQVPALYKQSIKQRIDSERGVHNVSKEPEMSVLDMYNNIDYFLCNPSLEAKSSTELKEHLLSQNKEKMKLEEQRGNSTIIKTTAQLYTKIQYDIFKGMWEISHS